MRIHIEEYCSSKNGIYMNRIFKKIERKILRIINSFFVRGAFLTDAIQRDSCEMITGSESKITTKTNLRDQKIKITISDTSEIVIGQNVTLSGIIIIDSYSRLIIGDNCILSNVNINLNNNSIFEINTGCIMDIPILHPAIINLNYGDLVFNEKVHNKASISVKFGGKMNIGTCTDIGYGTEIRCEEKIEIGQYCLFSYDVCIFDTNTHSTDYLSRRKLYDKGYPFGVEEVEKPSTSPVIIGNDVWIGKQATILKGSNIGDRSIVGIRTVVSSGNYKSDSRIVTCKPQIYLKG